MSLGASTVASTRAASSATSASRSTLSRCRGSCGASRRLASSTSSTRASSSATLRSISRLSLSRCGGLASSSIETAIFMRASGERSSWLALASSERCDCTSASTRAAATLKLEATAATSSRPETATRWPRSPPPNCSTPRLSISSRRVRRRTTGNAPAATAKKRTMRITARPAPRGTQGGRNGHGGGSRGPPRSSGGRSRRSPFGNGRSSWPGRIVQSMRPSSRRNEKGSTPSATRRVNESDSPMRWPAALSRASGMRRRTDHSRSVAACSAGGASTRGSECWIRSAQAPSRSLRTSSLRTRSWSRWRCSTQPETSANSKSTTTTVA